MSLQCCIQLGQMNEIFDYYKLLEVNNIKLVAVGAIEKHNRKLDDLIITQIGILMDELQVCQLVFVEKRLVHSKGLQETKSFQEDKGSPAIWRVLELVRELKV